MATGFVDPCLVGEWASTEAFGNTSLDWSEDVKAGKAVLHLTFTLDGRVIFDVDEGRAKRKTYAHVLPHESTFACNSHEKVIQMHADSSGLVWHYQEEGDDSNGLRLRLVGAKKFGRCKGVDVIYLKRVK
jgi:hypothetical protein